MEQIRLWPVNSLPIPFGASLGKVDEVFAEPEVDVNDNFPKGSIYKYFPHQGYGYIKDRTGRELCFKLAEMDFVGHKGEDFLKEGAVVGYDVSRSGKGLHVTKMKVY